MANIIGTNGNDTLLGTNDADTINGLAGNDTITGNGGDDTLTGGGGKDTFVDSRGSVIITDFGGIGKGVNPSAAVIAEVDTLFLDSRDAQNLLLTQNGSNLEITFGGSDVDNKVILQNFALENLDNLSKSTGATVDLGNIKFDGQTKITDSFDVFNADSTQSTIFNKNTVTFLNDLDNNVNGFDNSDDVINAQGGNDKIDGKSGNDLLRGGTGNDTLIGGAGNDTLIGGTGNKFNLNASSSIGDNLLDGGDGNDSLDISGADYLNQTREDIFYFASGNNTLNGGTGNDTLNANYSTGDNTLNGGAGNDYLSAGASKGNNLLSGDDGNDYLSVSEISNDTEYYPVASLGNNTLNGGAGNDYLRADSPFGNNLLSGGDGNDTLSTSGFNEERGPYSFSSSGNNTLNGGAGNDYLSATISTGNNLLSGGDGNDTLSISGTNDYVPSSGNNTLNGGAGNDYLMAIISSGDNLLSGDDGNDSFYVTFYVSSASDSAPSYLVTQTVDGGKGDDLLSVNDSNATAGITTTFNATTNIGSITAGTYQVNYKNIEGLNIIGTAYDDNILGSNGNDTLSTGGYGNGGNDTIDGGKGDDLLSVDLSNYLYNGDTTSTYNATTNIGSITVGTNSVSYKNIEGLNIIGTAYNNFIVGSNGNDTLSTGGYGNDTIDGGKGDDLLSVDYRSAGNKGITTTFNATTNIGLITAGTNSVSYKNIERLNILGTRGDDFIVGNNGNDTLSGGNGGNDTIDGGKGDDLLSIDYTNTFATGGIITTFNATTNIGLITAGTYRVSYKNIERLNISGTGYNDNIVGSNGNDTLSGGNGGNDTIIGGAGNDSLSASIYDGNNTFNGGAGDDILNVNHSPGNNLLGGDDGNDSLFAFNTYGKNTLNGGAGDDILNVDSSSGNNLLYGGDGNDTLSASGLSDEYYNSNMNSNNTLNGGAGDDILNVDGSLGANQLFGGDGNDTLSAYSALGNNILYGGNGNDYIIGGNGNDYLTGGFGNDSLIGGAGTDTFAFNSSNEGIDTIYDFNATNESIQVSATGFGGGLSIGSLQTSQFTLGTSATTSNQRFIYDNITGGLYFDLDGSASGFTQVKFAQLSPGLSLTKNDFVVV